MPLEGVRILLVTRDRPVHDRIRTLCSRIAPTFRGLEWTGSYRAALDAVETGAVDVCILDTALVDGAGINLLHEPSVRRRHIPMILLLAQPPPPDEDPLARPGVADWIVKDELDLSSLQRALRHAHQGRHARRRRHARQSRDAAPTRSRDRRDVPGRARTEQELRKENAELRDRIRTLETLLGVTTALRAPGLPLDRRLERIAGIVCEEGVLADRPTDARIVLHGKEFRTGGFDASAETHSIPIRSEDGDVGVLEIAVSGEEGTEASTDPPRMAELLDRIARELGTIPPRPDDAQH